MENSKIEWTHHTCNIWWGCMKVHAGCDNCYAEGIDAHYHKGKHWGAFAPRKIVTSAFNNLLKFQRMAENAGEIHRVFIGSMMDIFEKPYPVIDNKGEPMEINTGDIRNKLFLEYIPQLVNLQFLLLTKRPGNINKYIPEAWKTDGAPGNVMFGCSVVDQPTYNDLVPQLLEVKGRHFLSMEPLIGPVEIEYIPAPDNDAVGASRIWPLTGRRTDMARPCKDTGKVDWVIVGGESGHNVRPMEEEWAASIVTRCQENKVPVFFKQGSVNNWPDYKNFSSFPEDLQVRQFPISL